MPKVTRSPEERLAEIDEKIAGLNDQISVLEAKRNVFTSQRALIVKKMHKDAPTVTSGEDAEE